MGNKQIRIGQLIAPFGPGSLYTDRKGIPHVICGLDHWFKRSDPTSGLVACENPTEFQRFEPRLAALLHIDQFRSPPDYRAVRRGNTPPPNALLNVPALRFPSWYRHTATGQLRKYNLHSSRIDNPAGGGRWQPVRFVSACEGGHLNEFPWREWIGCQCPDGGDLYLTDRGGSELSSIRVECRTCPTGSSGRNGKSLSGTTIRPEVGARSAFEQAGITCLGERPWLGEGAEEQGCQHQLVGALINQINLYFPRTISAILLPDVQQQDDIVLQTRNEIEQDASICGIARTIWNMGVQSRPIAVASVKSSLDLRGLSRETVQIESALESLFNPTAGVVTGAGTPVQPESELLSFRRAEFNIIRNEVNDPQNIPNLRVIPSSVPSALDSWILKVNLIERLRETRVFYGFDRFQLNPQQVTDMPDSAMNQLFRNPPQQPQDRWLPAVEVFGEGIYIELREDRIREWQESNKSWLRSRVSAAFVNRMTEVYQILPPLSAATLEWACKYLVVHSLAHILINQLVYECGYSTASLRERLYISSDPSAPMAGILIYTSAGDSEGTMGGLVRLGRPDRLLPVVQRALSRASWCSADPVCSENLGGQGSRLANLAACHACILLPETSCETINQGLDRAMIVGEPTDRERGLFSSLVNSVSLYND